MYIYICIYVYVYMYIIYLSKYKIHIQVTKYKIQYISKFIWFFFKPSNSSKLNPTIQKCRKYIYLN